ncbi:MAG: aminomethyltransferase beta-barrel domain-containing protein, partial [Balneolaceae bacterium]|nr:aminomethyltransferase beta-barrel domain-containing protein [Balneolaceae bacterium]
PFYTIGQRRGLDLPLGKPVYVTHIDAERNVITIGEKEDLISTTLRAKEMNLVKYDRIPDGEMEITGKIRYNDNGAIGTLRQLSDDEMQVHFPAGREAITPGQAVVCYEDDDVVAGGWIHKVNIELEESAEVNA